MEELVLRWGPLALSAFGLLYAVGTARGKAASDRVAKIEATLDAVEDRVGKVEGEVKHLPDRDITHRLELAIGKLEGQIQVMDERLRPVSAMATRAQELLLEEARRDRVA